MSSNLEWHKAEVVLRVVAEASGYPVEQLTGKRRHRDLVNWRHFAMGEMRRLTSLSSVEIGKIFNRDHSSVLHAIKKGNENGLDARNEKVKSA